MASSCGAGVASPLSRPAAGCSGSTGPSSNAALGAAEVSCTTSCDTALALSSLSPEESGNDTARPTLDTAHGAAEMLPGASKLPPGSLGNSAALCSASASSHGLLTGIGADAFCTNSPLSSWDGTDASTAPCRFAGHCPGNTQPSAEWAHSALHAFVLHAGSAHAPSPRVAAFGHCRLQKKTEDVNAKSTLGANIVALLV
mmetsp:Transcript_25445/g.70938  ORF Transcript_25445/g.70938 Transcript_25445/m.70938 type:complete len:200 (-) Transcript_25445:504-1103(-)